MFFDLVFVIAVSVASGRLHHALSAGHIVPGLLAYAVCFFAIWWAWMAGIEVEIDVISHHSALSPTAATFAVTIPVAVFLLGIWWIAIRGAANRVVNVAVPTAAGLVLLDPLIPIPVTLTAVIMVALVWVLVCNPIREQADPSPTAP